MKSEFCIALLCIALLGLLLVGCSGPSSSQSDAAGLDAPAELFDDLSMPEEPTMEVGSIGSAEACGACHTQHYQEWKGSMHAYAMVDPVYRAAVRVRQADFEGLEDRFCLQCHSPYAVRSGEIQPGFAFDNLSATALEGINCETCHKVSSIERTYNAGMVIDSAGPIRGPIADPIDSPAHESEYSEDFEKSEFCAACHDVIETDGLLLERPYQEWQESPVADTQNCQSCHMPEYEGSAVDGAPIRTLHRHQWVGVDLPMIEGYVSDEEMLAQRARIAELLEGSGSVTLETAGEAVAGQQLDLFVTLKNNIPAHNLPTGSTFNRQLWLDLQVFDDSGILLYETGQLDDNGDLKNFFSEPEPYADPDLITLTSNFTGPLGSPEIFSWRAREHTSASLSPLYDRTYTLFVPVPETATGPLQIQASLRFRSHAPYLLRALDLGELVEKLVTFEIDSTTHSVPIAIP